MLAQPDGQAILNTAAAMAAVLSEAIDEQVSTGLISEAPAGSPGVCTLVVSRDSVGTTILLPQGTKFVTSAGVELGIVSDVTVGSAQQTIVLPLATLRQIDLVNTIDPAFDDVLEGQDTIANIVSPDDPVIYDDGGGVVLRPGYSSLAYVSSTPITGATMDWLSQHGNERGCKRQAGESAGAYRARVRQIPDAITPVAVQEAAQGAQAQANLPQVYGVETILDLADQPSRSAIGLVYGDSFCADGDFCDDPLGANLAAKAPLRALELLSVREARAYIRESIAGDIVEPDGFVLYADVGFCDDPLWGYPDIGTHPAISAALNSVYSEVTAKKAAGVQCDLSIENAQIINGAAALTVHAGSTSLAWSLLSDPSATPGSETTAWLIRDGMLGTSSQETGSGAPNPAVPGSVAQFLTFTFAGGGTFSTPPYAGPDSQHFTVSALQAMGFPFLPIVRIDAYAHDVGGFNVNATVCGTFWMSKYALTA
jgi:hypothetical protein